jgi:phospholipid transport system transporter-binding protein
MTAARIEATSDKLCRVEGVLDFATVGPLATEGGRLIADGRAEEIDLGAVVQANSAGLALLLEWVAFARQRQAPLRFRNLPESLLRIAELTNLGRLLPIVQGA